MTKTTLTPWSDCFLSQTHKTSCQTLIVSGCSFTSCYGITDRPQTWPGYLMVRAGFDRVIDLSAGGSGNEYISTSLLNQLESMDPMDLEKCMIIVMWSGILRQDSLVKDSRMASGFIDDIGYEYATDPENYKKLNPGEAMRSWKNIIMLQNYLENKNAKFGFSFLYNTFDPPFLPKRMNSNGDWNSVMSNKEKIKQLRNCQWIHDHQNCLYEYSFKNDCLQDDLFHPNVNGHLSWTDNVLLPGLEKMGLASPVDQ